MCGVEVTTEEDADGIVPLSAEESNENDLVFDLEIGTRSHWSLILLVGNCWTRSTKRIETKSLEWRDPYNCGG
jgi:hypothetical protein